MLTSLFQQLEALLLLTAAVALALMGLAVQPLQLLLLTLEPRKKKPRHESPPRESQLLQYLPQVLRWRWWSLLLLLLLLLMAAQFLPERVLEQALAEAADGDGQAKPRS